MKKTRQLYSISKFAYVMRRLYKKEQLTEEESEYILSCSLLLLKEYTHIGFDDAEEELKRMEEFRKVQAEVEQKKEKPMSQKMFKAV